MLYSRHVQLNDSVPIYRIALSNVEKLFEVRKFVGRHFVFSENLALIFKDLLLCIIENYAGFQLAAADLQVNHYYSNDG